jgi:beta-galactosidase/beta-glucuronidase
MHRRSFLLTSLSLPLMPTVLHAAKRIDLNGEWQFRVDTRGTGAKQGWEAKLPGDTTTVNVPHTWNLKGRYEDYEGLAWYFHTFRQEEGWRGRRVELHFGATFYKARVWLNGAVLGEHEGGYTRYFFDVTPHLKPVNYLAVEIDNRPGLTTIPGYAMKLRGSDNVWYDWWHYGGIVRDVWLQTSGPALLRRQQVRSRLEGTTGAMNTRVFIENHAPRRAGLRLLVRVFGPGGTSPEATAGTVVTIDGATRKGPGRLDESVPLRVENARRWHFDDPTLYRVQVDLSDARGNLLDRLEENIGFRDVEVRNRGLYLNGERVRLTGVTRHQESPWEGLAETRGTMQQDFDALKDLQVTLTRPVHYPQHPAVLDYCDRNGILLIPEIPMWQFSEQQMANPKVVQLARQMMTEMVQEAYNHPCIWAWSVCNESATNTPGGLAYFQAMREHLRALDPGRLVSYADDQISAGVDPKNNAASLADFIMMNQYFGTWHGPAENLIPRLEQVGREYPDKMVIISEFGAAGMFAPDKAAGDRLRVKILREQMEAFGKFDFIAGAIFWCYQDYKSHRNLRPGERSGMVEMGLVDENRQRYPSYSAWRELNMPAQVELRFKFQEGRPSGFLAVVRRKGSDSLPSYELRNYRIEWRATGVDGVVLALGDRELPTLGEPLAVEASWTPSSGRSVRLEFRLLRPTGFVAAEKSIDWWEGVSGGYTTQEMERRGISVPER